MYTIILKVAVLALVDVLVGLISQSFYAGIMAGMIGAYICMLIDDFSNNSIGKRLNETLTTIENEVVAAESDKDIAIINFERERDRLNAEIKELNAKNEISDGKIRIAFEKVDAAERKYQALNKDYRKLEHENNRIWKLLEEAKDQEKT